MGIRYARSNLKLRLLVGAAAGLAFLVAPASSAFAQGMTLQGVWVVETQPRNCSTYAPIGAPHRALVSYHAGGTVSDSSAVPIFAVGQRSEGHGTWSHSGGHTYTANWVAMIAFGTEPNTPPGSPGFEEGWQVATNTVTLSGPDTFTSVGVSYFVNLSRGVYRIACASRVGERFK